MKTKKKESGSLSKYGLLLALIIIIFFFQIVTGGKMITPLNITNILMQNSYIIILSIGMLFVIIAGDFDMSVGYGAGFIGAVCASLIVRKGMPVPAAIAISIGLGILMGLYEGWFVAYFKVPAFVTTLGNMMVFHGLMLMVLDSETVGPTPAGLNQISMNYVSDITVGGIKIITMIVAVIVAVLYVFFAAKTRKDNVEYGIESSRTSFIVKSIIVVAVILFIGFMFARYNGIPLILILLAVIIGVYSFVGNHTVFGRRIYAIGGNEKATRLSGVNTKKVKLLVFTNMGLMTGLAGVVYLARLNYATLSAGADFAMDAIAACFIGGASSKGGAGTIFGTIVGALVMGILNNGMQMMGLGTDAQEFVKGLVLIFAVLLDVMTKSGNRE